MLKVAIDSGPLTSGHAVRGIGVNTRELLEAFKSVPHENTQIAQVDFSKEDLSKFDVVHYQYFRPFFVDLPFMKPAKKVILTIHDLIPLIYSDHYPPGLKGKIKFLINKYLIKKNVDAIITISETSKKDICRFLGVHPRIVHVVYLAPRPIFRKLEIGSWKGASSSMLKIAKRYNLPDRFALYVGDINYNKNIPNLLTARKIAKIPLVIVGKQAKEIENQDLDHPELRHLKNLNWSSVIRLGFVQDEDLVAIYNLASVYVQPSFYEGFGLPVLEAVVCKTPVVATKTQALVEILGDGLNYVDPYNAKAMAESILNPNKNVNLPRVYSWEKTAKQTLTLYEQK
jgi:glycosyltransferase involved in cell wall biosynthesis